MEGVFGRIPSSTKGVSEQTKTNRKATRIKLPTSSEATSCPFGVSQTCLGTNVLSGLVPGTVFKTNLWAFLGPCVRGRGRPWYGTSAQPESHFTCSSPKGAPWVVLSTSLLNYFWAFLGPWGRARGRPWYGTLAKPRSHFTEGMFEKRWSLSKRFIEKKSRVRIIFCP